MVHIRRILAALAALGVAGVIFAIAAVLYKDQNPPEAQASLFYVKTYDGKKDCTERLPGGKIESHPAPCRPTPPK